MKRRKYLTFILAIIILLSNVNTGLATSLNHLKDTYGGASLEDIERRIKEVEDELLEIDYVVEQSLRSKIESINTDLNTINDWASKEALMDRISKVEEDVNIKDLLGYLKGQIDAYTQSPSEGLKKRIEEEMKVLKGRIEAQGLKEQGAKNMDQWKILAGLLNGDTDTEIQNEIERLLKEIENALAVANTGSVPSTIIEKMNRVENLIGSLASGNGERPGYLKKYNLLTEDTSIKNALYSLENKINSFEKNPTDENLKKSIEIIIDLYRGFIDKQELTPHKGNNEARLEDLIGRYEKIIEDGKYKEIEDLLSKIRKDLENRNGEPALSGTTDDMKKADGLIKALDDGDAKDDLRARYEELQEDIDIKKRLKELEKNIMDYDKSLKDRIESEIGKLSSDIDSQSLEPHKDHNRKKLNSLKDFFEKEKEEVEGEQNKKIQELLDALESVLSELKGDQSSPESKEESVKINELINELGDNEYKENFKNQLGHLDEDIKLKDRIKNLNDLMEDYERNKDEIARDLEELKSDILDQYLIPHKIHNLNKIHEIEDEIKEKELEGSKNKIDDLLEEITKELEVKKGDKADSTTIRKYDEVNRLIDNLPDKGDYPKTAAELGKDIKIKDDLASLSDRVDGYRGDSQDKEKILEEMARIRGAIIGQTLMPHKDHNLDKLKEISDNLAQKDKEIQEGLEDGIAEKLEKIKNDLAGLNGEEITESIGDDMDWVYNAIKDLPGENPKKPGFERKFGYLYEDAVIKNQLKYLDDRIKAYGKIPTLEEEKEIAGYIKRLEARIDAEVLTLHKKHNLDKLNKLKKDFNSINITAIEDLLSKIIKDLEDIKGQEATSFIRKDIKKVKIMIFDLPKDDSNLARYKDIVYSIDQDVDYKDRIGAIDRRVKAYNLGRISEEALKLEEDIEQLALEIREKQILYPHKEQNLSRLSKISKELGDKTEGEYETDIEGLLEKIKRELEDLKGEAPKEGSSIADDLAKVDGLIEKLSDDKGLQYRKDSAELHLDYNNKNRLKTLNDFIDSLSSDEIKDNLEVVGRYYDKVKGFIERQTLKVHRGHNLGKLKKIESKIIDKLEEKNEKEILTNLEKIRQELADRKGEPAEDSTRTKLKGEKDKINALGSTSKSKERLLQLAEELKEDIEIKDDLEELKRKIDGYDGGGKDEIKEEFERLHDLIFNQTLTPHKVDNMGKLEDLYVEIKDKIDKGEAEDKEEYIKKLLEEIEGELDSVDGDIASGMTRLKEERVALLIDSFRESGDMEKYNEFLETYTELKKDTDIKDEIKIANDFVGKYDESWTEEAVDDLKKFINLLSREIDRQKLEPHKDDNRKKLKDIQEELEDKLKAKDGEIEKLLNKIEKELKDKNGDPASKETKDSLNRVKNLIDSLSDKDENKVGFLNRYDELRDDSIIKDDIPKLNALVEGFNKDSTGEDRKMIEDGIASLIARIKGQNLEPHKTHNKDKLDKIIEKYEEKAKEFIEQESEKEIIKLLKEIKDELEDKKGYPADKSTRVKFTKVNELIGKLGDDNSNKEIYKGYEEELWRDVEVKDIIESVNKLVGAFDENSTQEDRKAIEDKILEAKAAIRVQSLEPHKTHNNNRLKEIEDNYMEKQEDLSGLEEVEKEDKIRKLLDKVRKDLENRRGEYPLDDTKIELLEVDYLIRSLSGKNKNKEAYKREYGDLEEDAKVKDELRDLESDIRKIDRNASESEKSRIKDRISKLKQRIKNQNLKPHKNHNMDKLGRLENLFENRIKDRPSGGGSSGGGSSSDRDKDRDKDKNKDKDKDENKQIEEIEKDLEEIEKEIEKHEKDKDHNLGDIEKEVENVEKEIEDVKDLDKKEDLETELEKLKSRVEKLRSIIRIDSNFHKAYLNGYEDNTLKPEGTATRGEVAAIIYRIVDQERLEDMKGASPSFSDVNTSLWSYEYIDALSRAGILNGYEDGSFRPNNNITRGEVAVIISKINGLYERDISRLIDIEDYWGAGHINAVYLKGWIKGYEDSSFKPNNNITRAEMATMINGVLERKRQVETGFSDIPYYKDLNENQWYYEEMIEAVTDHKP